MITDATVQSVIYYTPYNGNQIPIYDGSVFVNKIFASDLTMTLEATNNLSGKLYDIFAFMDGATLRLGAAPAWTNDTTRSAAITRVNGLWVNNAIVTLTNGATSYASIPANRATYLGTVYCTANAQTAMMFKPSGAAGGSANILGLYNAYNRVDISSEENDSTASWAYTTAAWRASNNNANNSITFIDGLQQSFIRTEFLQRTVGAGDGTHRGINLDSTSAAPNRQAFGISNASNISDASVETFNPQLGKHYIQAMEYGNASNSQYGGVNYNLRLTMEM